MKKIILTLCGFLVVICANAQGVYDDTRHEVAVSYGTLANSQWIDVLEEVVIAMTGATFDNERFLGPVAFEYFYHASNWLGVGGVFVVGNSVQDVLKDNVKDGRYIHSYYTLMPAVKFDWLRREHIGMYSKLAAGATLRREKTDSSLAEDNDPKTDFHFNFQVSLLGFEAGGPTTRGFVELGVGEQGIVLLGLRHKF